MYSIVIYDHDGDYHKPIAFPMIVPFVMSWIGAANLPYLHRYAGCPHARVPH